MAVREASTTSVDRNVVWLVVLGVIVLGLAGWIVFDLFFSRDDGFWGLLDEID